MSKGGGQKTTTQQQQSQTAQNSAESSNFFSGSGNTGSSSATRNPWGLAIPGLTGAMDALTSTSGSSLQDQIRALMGGVDYAKTAFGGAPNATLGDATGAVSGILSGQGAGAAGGYGSAAGTALGRMLSGQADYGGLEGAINAANAPILRQLNEEIIPGLNQRATFLNNGTGGIKALNRVLPEVGARMGENAAALTNAERIRALNDQQTGLGLYGQMNNQVLQAGSLLPQLLQSGLLPSQLEAQLGGLPFEQARTLAGSLLPFGGLGGDTTASESSASAGLGGSSGVSSGTSNTNSTGTTTERMSGGGLGQVLGNVIGLASLFGGFGGLGSLLGKGLGMGMAGSSALGNSAGTPGFATGAYA